MPRAGARPPKGERSSGLIVLEVSKIRHPSQSTIAVLRRSRIQMNSARTQGPFSNISNTSAPSHFNRKPAFCSPVGGPPVGVI